MARAGRVRARGPRRLLAQLRAAAAASVTRGSGDLDLALVMADGSMTGRADPAFAAHETPIGMGAEAVWESWLPQAALSSLVEKARRDFAGRSSPWAIVRGPMPAKVGHLHALTANGVWWLRPMGALRPGRRVYMPLSSGGS